MAEKFIQKATDKMEAKGTKGTFKKWAKSAGFKDTCSAATAVLAGKDSAGKDKTYSEKMKSKANFANNTGCKKKSPMQNGGKVKKPKTTHHHTIKKKPKSKEEKLTYLEQRKKR